MLKQGKTARSPRHMSVVSSVSSPRSLATSRNPSVCSSLPRKDSTFRWPKSPLPSSKRLKRCTLFSLQDSNTQMTHFKSILRKKKASIKQYRAVLRNYRVLFSSLCSLWTPSGKGTQDTAFLAVSKKPSLSEQLLKLQTRTCRVLCSLKTRTNNV